jgi:transposase
VVVWATKALDAMRRRLTAQLRRDGQHEAAAELRKTRWALLKNPPNQSSDLRTTVAAIARTNKLLYTAYLLKEQLRAIFETKGAPGRALLAGWICWARCCRIPEFVKLAETITRYRTLILNTLDHAVSNARVEATNTHLRLLTRRAYGFHTSDWLIAMADHTRGGLCPPLPGRTA